MSTKTRNARTAQKAVAAARAGQRGHRTIMGIGGAVIVALVAAIAIAVVTAMGDAEPGADGPLVVPAAATADGGIRIGQDGAKSTVAVYLDYMCPYCGKFERANHADLEAVVADGAAALELHPLAFLDKQSRGTEYSTRAANAVVTVADKAAGNLLAFNTALFENQPEEGTEGLDDARIAELASGAGVPRNVIDLFADRTYVPWIAQSTEAAFDNGITGTPTVKINGAVTDVDLYTPGPLRQAITGSAQ